MNSSAIVPSIASLISLISGLGNIQKTLFALAILILFSILLLSGPVLKWAQYRAERPRKIAEDIEDIKKREIDPQLKEQLIARMISQKRPEFDNTKDVIDEALDSSINNAFVLGVCVGTSVCYYVATIIRYHLNGFSINLQGMVVMAVKAFPNGGFQSETVTYLNGFPILVVLLFVSVKCVTIIFPYFKKRERYYSVVIVPVTFIFLIGIGFW